MHEARSCIHLCRPEWGHEICRLGANLVVADFFDSSLYAHQAYALCALRLPLFDSAMPRSTSYGWIWSCCIGFAAQGIGFAPKARRSANENRPFSREDKYIYKLHVVQKSAACHHHGQICALLMLHRPCLCSTL